MQISTYSYDIFKLAGNHRKLPHTRLSAHYLNIQRTAVHWCHGAPGAVFLLCKAHEVFGGGGKGAAYLPAACRAGEVVWARGILRKGGHK
eukprot:1161795-Pelagomonas_calceolata.AAC.7